MYIDYLSLLRSSKRRSIPVSTTAAGFYQGRENTRQVQQIPTRTHATRYAQFPVVGQTECNPLFFGWLHQFSDETKDRKLRPSDFSHTPKEHALTHRPHTRFRLCPHTSTFSSCRLKFSSARPLPQTSVCLYCVIMKVCARRAADLLCSVAGSF